MVLDGGASVPRWTDDRVDDLAQLVRANDTRLDHVEDITAAHERIFETMNRRNDRHWQLWFMFLTTMIASLATLIAALISNH